MFKKVAPLIVAIIFSINSFGQSYLRDSVISITSFQFGYTPCLTAFDMGKKSDFLHVFSPSLSYKNGSNWYFKGSVGLIVGHNSLERNTPNMVFSELGLPISADGILQEMAIRFQGFSFGFELGKLIKVSDHNLNSGLYVAAGIGFLQHRIKFDYLGQGVLQLEEPYIFGYDRLTNGTLINQFIGWRRYSNKNSFNYELGLELNQGLTRNRRSWNYDLFGPANELRLDFYYGLRMNVILPFYGVSSR
ncbi:MAG: hypothetical protein JXQ87_13390 [Bacteroidia bacterium]